MLEAFSFLWTEVLYRPIFNLFIWVYNNTPGPNVGWAVIGLALLIRLLFLNSTFRGYQTDRVIEEIGPELQRIEDAEKYDRREKRRRITELLKGKEINLYHEFYVLFAQIVFLIILYAVFQYGFNPEGLNLLYKGVEHPEVVNTVFYGINLAKPSFYLSFIAAALLFIQLVWEYNQKKSFTGLTFSERWFPLLLSLFTYILLVILPSAKSLFIGVSVLFSLILKIIITMAGRRGNQITAPSHH